MQADLIRKLRRLDRGLALTLLLCLIAASAFLLRPSLPRETDAELHVFRSAELGYSLRAGEFYPRWAPDFYYGYGYPFFNYYAPLTYYLANVLSLGIPGGAVFGTKAVLVVTYLLAGFGTYGLARCYGGSWAGLLASASYLFAPYVFLIDPHLRGDVAEFVSLGIAPMVFWAVLSFQRSPTRAHLLASALSTTALILSHNLLGLVFFGMLACFVVWNAAVPTWQDSPSPLRLVMRGILPMALGVALAAFFWLPVAMESNAVQLSNVIGPGHFDFRGHFLDLRDLLGPSFPLDLGAVNPAFRFNLGLAQWMLAVVGAVSLVVIPRGTRRTPATYPDLEVTRGANLVFLPLSALVLVLLMTRVSLPLWEAFSPMAYLQFPWRLLGPAALTIALTGSLSVRWIPRFTAKARPLVFASLLSMVLLTALPIFVPPTWGNFGSTDILALLDFELHGLALGTTSTGDFVPTTVTSVPGPNAELITSYRRGGAVDRINRQTLPEGAAVQILRQRPTSDVVVVQSPEAFVLRFYRFMFPGWRAAVDGQPVAIQIAEPEGFITVEVPAGSHTVHLWMGPTSARLIAGALSLAGLLALFAFTWHLPRDTRSRDGKSIVPDFRSSAAVILGFVLVAGLGGALGWFQPRSTGIIAAPAGSSLHAYLQGGIDVIGYDLPVASVRPGGSLPVTIYWKAREPVPENYQVFVHLTSIPEHTWGQSDKLNPGDYPTTRWPLDRYVRDPHSLTAPLGTPPGTYTIRVGLWNHKTGIRQLLLAEDGTILGDSVALPHPISVLPAREQPPVEALPLDARVERLLDSGIELLGVDLQPGPTFEAPAGRLYVVLYWRATRPIQVNRDISVRLVAEDGAVAASHSAAPVDGLFLMAQWLPGQVIRDVHSLWIDESIPVGHYRIEVGLGDGELGADEWVLLTLLDRTLP